ncbi:MAG: hypothetical protein ACYCW6_12380, partial [Candidatus Xenobia bacterium]
MEVGRAGAPGAPSIIKNVPKAAAAGGPIDAVATRPDRGLWQEAGSRGLLSAGNGIGGTVGAVLSGQSQ